MIIFSIIVLLIGFVLTVVIFRYDNGNKFFSVISKIYSVILLFLSLVGIFFAFLGWITTPLTGILILVSFLVLVALEGILEFPDWEGWHLEYW